MARHREEWRRSKARFLSAARQTSPSAHTSKAAAGEAPSLAAFDGGVQNIDLDVGRRGSCCSSGEEELQMVSSWNS